MILAQLFEESRTEFLRAKYVPLLDAKYHAIDPGTPDGWQRKRVMHDLLQMIVGDEEDDDDSVGKTYAEIIFEWFLKLDPSPKKIYTQWILNLFVKDKLIGEDAYKAEEYLRLFDSYKHLMPPESRDINQYNDIRQLYQAVIPYGHAESKREVDRKLAAQANAEAEVIYDDPEYKVVVPKSRDAACYFGRNTQWCTAARNSWNAFHTYNNEGPLYIILDKKNNRRWQFHFESNQFMDEHDEQINQSAFLDEHPKIAQIFYKIKGINTDVMFQGKPVIRGGSARTGYDYKVLTSFVQRSSAPWWGAEGAYGLRVVANKYNMLDRIQNMHTDSENDVAALLNQLGIQGEEVMEAEFIYSKYGLMWDGHQFVAKR